MALLDWQPEGEAWSSHGMKPGDPDTLMASDDDVNIEFTIQPDGPGKFKWALFAEGWGGVYGQIPMGEDLTYHPSLEAAKAAAEDLLEKVRQT